MNGDRAPPVTPPAGTLYILGDKIMTPFVGGLSWMPMAVFAAQICPASVRFGTTTKAAQGWPELRDLAQQCD